MNEERDFEEYERIVRDILESEIKRDCPKAKLQVFRGRAYTGKSGQKHKIDVSAEIVLGKMRVVILCECKLRTSKKIASEEVQVLAYRVGDIPEANKGLFVTSRGYQKGAKRIARANGIALAIKKKRDNPPSWEVVMPSLFTAVLLEAKVALSSPETVEPKEKPMISASDDDTSAIGEKKIERRANLFYWSNFDGMRYTYLLEVQNTTNDLDIYAIAFGFRFGEPLNSPLNSSNSENQCFLSTLPIKSPAKWSPFIPATYGGNAGWSASWNGSRRNGYREASGYILPGTSLTGFKFSSLTPPPAEVPCNVSFHDKRKMSWGGGCVKGNAIYLGEFSE
jgi:hypothetical protein